jgi:hypothetical protein
MDPKELFLCKHFDVNSLYDIVWYPNDVVRTSEVGKSISVNMTMPLAPECTLGQVPLKGPEVLQPHPRRKYKGMDIDLNHVCIQNIMVRGYNNPNNCEMGLRCNTLPRELIKDMSVYDRTKAAAYGRKELAGLRMHLKSNTNIQNLEDNEVTYFYHRQQGIPSTKPEWVKCTGLLHENNITNYIVKIPHEVCVATNEWVSQNVKDQKKAKKKSLPVFIQREGLEPLENSINHWYAVPFDHILATYCYAPEAVLESRNIICKMVKYRRGNAPPKGFFFIADKTLEDLKKQLVNGWFSRRDIRPLNKVGFQAVTLKQHDQPDKTICINTSVTYIGWPAFTHEQMSTFMPTCNADLVSWVYFDVFKDPNTKKMLKTFLPLK